MRQEYEARGLDIADVADDPVEQFQRWLTEALDAGLVEPNAMVLSTVDATGAPSSRHVLLKGLSAGGLEFYTNYESGKGRDIVGNDAVALAFPWLGLHRQVCIAGQAAPLTDAESDAYFTLRPRAAQLGAWASSQSSQIDSREVLDDRMAEMTERFPELVPRPSHWGGYRVTPRTIEFWQGRPSRLHDRIRFVRTEDDSWSRSRLAP